MLISEAHVTSRSSLHIPGFSVYLTPHPDGTSHAGTAIIIKNNLIHYPQDAFVTAHLQASSVQVEVRGGGGTITLSAVYCPPRHKISEAMFADYFKSLGSRFIAGGDWNAKHTVWGSRTSTTRGRELEKIIDSLHLTPVSSGEPTYWPTDTHKIPDLLDFFLTKNLSDQYLSVEYSLDGSSDHTPVIITISPTVLFKRKGYETLTNKGTDWRSFVDFLNSNINLTMPLSNNDELDLASLYFTNIVQNAVWKSSPAPKTQNASPSIPLEIRAQIKEKRRLRRVWHQSRHPADKTALNRAIKVLREQLQTVANETLRRKLEQMSPSYHGEYSLWKATSSKHKPQQPSPPIRGSATEWARTDSEKAEAFATYLENVFKPNPASNTNDHDDIDKIMSQDLQLCLPLAPTSPRELYRMITLMDSKRSPGYDLITVEILKKLPKKCLVFLSNLFNATFRLCYFPAIWKVSQIIMIHKPNKPAHEASSYRPISLTPVLSKLWERIVSIRLDKLISEVNFIPSHQFGFRRQHSTIEQVHRVYHEIRQSLETKQYCSAAFLDVQQAFDRVWHKGLLC